MMSNLIVELVARGEPIGIVVGTRYIHTVCEMIDRADLRAARDILAAYIAAH